MVSHVTVVMLHCSQHHLCFAVTAAGQWAMPAHRQTIKPAPKITQPECFFFFFTTSGLCQVLQTIRNVATQQEQLRDACRMPKKSCLYMLAYTLERATKCGGCRLAPTTDVKRDRLCSACLLFMKCLHLNAKPTPTQRLRLVIRSGTQVKTSRLTMHMHCGQPPLTGDSTTP